MVIETQEAYAQLVAPEMLARLMKLHGWTVRDMAEEASLRLRRTYKQRLRLDPNAPRDLKRGTIGNLRSGYRKNCHPDVAEVISDIFKLPIDSLFATKVSNVQREVRGKEAA